jgi:hypothetical protein
MRSSAAQDDAGETGLITRGKNIDESLWNEDHRPIVSGDWLCVLLYFFRSGSEIRHQ